MHLLFETIILMIGRNARYAIYEIPEKKYFCKVIETQEGYKAKPVDVIIWKVKGKWVHDQSLYSEEAELLFDRMDAWFDLSEGEKAKLSEKYKSATH